ncbi:MAG: zinc ABC transporter substrate-binding protein [Thermoplasmata archaeon]|nr:zinc ABC transporter substrate-binding protein [Thermoplasmata archaeon]MCI4359498.1 zinc ABC transporter substrate-binding protein [Thermoplasmata archaeon]
MSFLEPEPLRERETDRYDSMQKWVKLAAAIVFAIAVASVGTYAVLTSTPPANPCRSATTSLTTPGHSTSAAGPGTQVPGDAALRHPGDAPSASGVIHVVAAENFWGSLASQLGGNHTSVLSIVTDPNADPHEYEANSTDATAISTAQFIIVNGVGYDNWALQLVAADGQSNQVVLNVGTLNGPTVGGGIVSGNPHMWYNPIYVNRTVQAIFSDLVSLQPGSMAYFQQQYADLNASLGVLYGEAAQIKAHFAGTEVAATEDIFVYLANYTNLNLVSPPQFMEAVAEGNDPPAQSVVQFQCQLEGGQVKVLVYNQQTVTPITIQLKAIAAAHNVTIVGVTETIQPPGVDFQTWMDAEYLQLYNALNANALGK